MKRFLTAASTAVLVAIALSTRVSLIQGSVRIPHDFLLAFKAQWSR